MRIAVDGRNHVAALKARCGGGAAGLYGIDPRRRARLAEKCEQAGKDHDRQNEIRNRTGSDDRRARSYFLVMEAALRSSSVMPASVSLDGVEASLSSPKNLT